MATDSTEVEQVLPPAARSAARRADKVAAKRDELARAARKTLSELGYAGTSLREIAANSEYSHGVLHYYFSDKLDLIAHCVHLYKAECVASYDGIIDESEGEGAAEALRRRFADRLAETMEHDLPTHKLWYDLRMQAVFERTLVEDVRAIDDELESMVWRVVSRYAELAGGEPIMDAAGVYAALDGPFERAVRRRCDGEQDAAAELSRQLHALLGVLVRRTDVAQ
ncbi:TetR/AcrR family transcriptional regulator [Gordonia hydrophobica]|uniref:TetR/AcrR family transcriptional regulator n=1 Tax=Gordonia hydrophobica TaxID=40516 RepID=A0ABZ2U2Q6_9ACTN|nr:TetR/AcrR family transcriptional regulator [Gordonia hydrophobica]MBM7368966.1 AcrR family transcriptional regulator [Gordonia hydrophobica]